MGIEFLKNENIFHLSGGDVSYILKIYKNAFPMHLYWGKRLSDPAISWYLEAPYRRKKLLEGTQPDDPMFLHEFWPYEYPEYGMSDYRPAALEVVGQDGCCISELRYEDYEILEGSVELPGLPSVWAEKEDAQTLKLILKDQILQLQAELYYTVFENTGAITRHTVLKNLGKDSLKIKKALSMSLDMKHAPYEMLQLSGTALREHWIERRKLGIGETYLESTRGISSHQENPFFALVEKETTEQNGDAYGVTLVYSGNFLAGVSCDMYRSARVQIGIHPGNFGWKLEAGEEFVTPQAVLSYSPKGLNGMSSKFHDLFLNHLYKGKFQHAPRPIVINTWEAAYFNFDHQTVLELAKKAAKAGIEMLVLDDGWFGHRDDDTTSLGDWFENSRKLPKGLKGLAEDVNALGMQFGLWFEPEMVSPDSELYRNHPDWCIHINGRKRSQWRHQLYLDLSRKEVQDYIIDSLSHVLSSANISYVKWDCNRRISEPGSEGLPPERQDELLHRYVLGLYHVMDVLTKRFPDVLFENCASGGARMDAGMMYYFPQTWASDNSDAVCRLKIQYGTSLCYPPVMTTSHISASPNHQMLRQTPLDFRAAVSYPFNLGYELNLCKMSDEEIEKISEQTALYKKIRPLVQGGKFYRLLSPFEGNQTAWMTVSQDEKEFLVWYYKDFADPEEAYINVRLTGLEEKAHYQDEGGNVYSGDMLMNLGLPIQWKNGDCFYQMWHFKRLDGIDF